MNSYSARRVFNDHTLWTSLLIFITLIMTFTSMVFLNPLNSAKKKKKWEKQYWNPGEILEAGLCGTQLYYLRGKRIMVSMSRTIDMTWKEPAICDEVEYWLYFSKNYEEAVSQAWRLRTILKSLRKPDLITGIHEKNFFFFLVTTKESRQSTVLMLKAL